MRQALRRVLSSPFGNVRPQHTHTKEPLGAFDPTKLSVGSLAMAANDEDAPVARDAREELVSEPASSRPVAASCEAVVSPDAAIDGRW